MIWADEIAAGPGLAGGGGVFAGGGVASAGGEVQGDAGFEHAGGDASSCDEEAVLSAD